MSLSDQELELLLNKQKESTKMLLRRDLELSKINEKLQKLDREKSEFVSIAAHQLRTPLSAIRWAQQMLLDGDLGVLTEEQKKILLQAQASIHRMISLVHELLSVDHLEYGQVHYEKFDHNMNLIVRSSIEEFVPMAKEKKVTISFVPSDGLALVYCDSEKIKEVLANIISNAIKYTLSGGEISLTVSVKDDNILITCLDNGIGIPKADTGRLFQKFSRSDNAKKIDADGSGLGLFIVKKIVEDNDGTVVIKSTEGMGTTVIVSLPKVIK